MGRQIDDFLDKVSESGILFKHGVDAYLKGSIESFTKKIEDIATVEHAGDASRRALVERLYTQTLIPESRGDVLELLESMDGLLGPFSSHPTFSRLSLMQGAVAPLGYPTHFQTPGICYAPKPIRSLEIV